MILHAAWDIIIRIPGSFCNNVDVTFQNVANVVHDVLELGIFPIVAILICVTYKGAGKVISQEECIAADEKAGYTIEE